ncbi:MAG: PIG-L family deacetylase [Chloroflexota bacterium]|nr:PIG-L family deacetylase [Chloroflexota bacterium]
MSSRDIDAATDLTSPSTHHFLSPHYDDIALSCGGMVALLAGAGIRPRISVAFGAAPDPNQPLSSFAAAMHETWGLAAADVIARRRQEEAAAAELLGATSASLSLTDAIYRGSWYQDDAALLGTVPADEAPLAGQITRELLDAAGHDRAARFYAPLGIGGHVDHQICFAAGVELASAGRDVWFYEDLPYALQLRARATRLQRIAAAWPATAPASLRTAHLTPVAHVDIGPVWDRKLAAIFAYASQVPAIFRHIGPDGSPDPIAAALRDYATRRGDGFPTERLWRLRQSESETETA